MVVREANYKPPSTVVFLKRTAFSANTTNIFDCQAVRLQRAGIRQNKRQPPLSGSLPFRGCQSNDAKTELGVARPMLCKKTAKLDYTVCPPLCFVLSCFIMSCPAHLSVSSPTAFDSGRLTGDNGSLLLLRWYYESALVHSMLPIFRKKSYVINNSLVEPYHQRSVKYAAKLRQETLRHYYAQGVIKSARTKVHPSYFPTSVASPTKR